MTARHLMRVIAIAMGCGAIGSASNALAAAPPARRFVLEARIGGGGSRLFPDASAIQGGEAMGYGAAVRALSWLRIGYEHNGVLREGGPPDVSGGHTDQFLVDQLVVASVLPLGAKQGIGGPRLRVGVGWASLKTQYTLDDQRTNERHRGVAYTAGVGYTLPVGAQFSIGLDVGLTRHDYDDGPVERADLIASTFLIQIHP